MPEAENEGAGKVTSGSPHAGSAQPRPDASSPLQRPPSHDAGTLAGAATLLYAWWMLLPWSSGASAHGIDVSWMRVYEQAWLRGWQQGVDIVFTYGPYGFVAGGGGVPGLHVLGVALWAMAIAVWFITFWRLTARATPRVTVRVLLSVLAIHGLNFHDNGDALAYSLLVLYVWQTAALLADDTADGLAADGHTAPPDGMVFRLPRRAADGVAYTLLMATIAWEANVKFSFLVTGTLTVALVSLVAARRRHWTALGLPALMVAGGVWWVLGGQSLGTLPQFIYRSIQITAAYSEGMAANKPAWWGLIQWLTVGVLAAGAAVGCRQPGRPYSTAGFVLATGLVWALCLKASLVRHAGGHLGMTLASLGPLILAIVWRQSVRGRAVAALRRALFPLGMAALIAITVGLGFQWKGTSAWKLYVASPIGWPQRGRDLRTFIGLGDDPASIFQPPSLRLLMNLAPGQPADLDIYNFNQEVVMGQDVEYRPRPVFQSYQACSTALASLNAEHLARSGPTFILHDMATIDNRYPALDDNLSFPVLARLYDPVRTRLPVALLRRRAQARHLTFLPPHVVKARLTKWVRLDQLGVDLNWVDVPSAPPAQHVRAWSPGAGLWLRVDVRRSLGGKIQGMVLQPAALWMDLSHRDGRQESYRLLLDQASSGFVIVPTLTSPQALARWLECLKQRWPVMTDLVAVRFRPENPSRDSWAFDPEITVSGSRITQTGPAASGP